MSNIAISVDGLGKQYEIQGPAHRHSTFYDLLSHSFGLALKGRQPAAPTAEPFQALRDVNFEIEVGEVVGIIGRNGAGKSTLLKILSRITAPTRGRVSIKGKLASLLEVGTGFHPELSGRENIFLNGSILGMRRAEISRKFDEIVAFAEVEQFIDTPVKRYSSGMYVRLAFSIAAHLEPDILIVDEVLAVGDAAFQAKCIGKMSTIGRSGTTVLVVSHNMTVIQTLCSRALLLEKGVLTSSGSVQEAFTKYVSRHVDATSTWTPPSADDAPFQYERVEITSDTGSPVDVVHANEDVQLRFTFSLSRPVTGRIAFKIRDQHGVVILTSSNTDAFSFLNKTWRTGRHQETCTIPAGWLIPGSYWISIARPLPEGDEIIEDVCRFQIARIGSLTERDARLGVVAPLLNWQAREFP